MIRTLDAGAAGAAVPALAQILLDCVAGGASVSFLADLTREEAEAFWHGVVAAVASGERRLIVAEDEDGSIVGTVQLIVRLPPNQPHRGEIAKMLVARSARRRGIGAALMRAAEAEARAAGKSLLTLDTVSGSEGERLYRSLGWEVAGEIPDFAMWPDGRLCPTTYLYRRVPTRLRAVSGFLVVALLVSAALHAGWNAAARMRPNPGEAFASFVIASGIWSLAALPFLGVPAAASLPWAGASIIVNVVSLRALIGAYERTSFALAYPFARGLTPPMVLGIAFLVAGEWPGRVALAGLALVSLAILALTLLARRGSPRDLSGIAFAALAAAGSGAAAVFDASGVRVSGNPLGYSAAMAIANAITFAIVFRIEGRRPFAGLIAAPGFAALWSFGSMISYSIILWAFTQADAALVAAVRETSVLFATAFAAIVLREKLTPLHWVASGLAAAGVVLIRLG